MDSAYKDSYFYYDLDYNVNNSMYINYNGKKLMFNYSIEPKFKMFILYENKDQYFNDMNTTSFMTYAFKKAVTDNNVYGQDGINQYINDIQNEIYILILVFNDKIPTGCTIYKQTDRYNYIDSTKCLIDTDKTEQTQYVLPIFGITKDVNVSLKPYYDILINIITRTLNKSIPLVPN